VSERDALPRHTPNWDERFAEVLERASADPNVLGLVVIGSRGAGLFVTERSDYDAFVVLDRADSAWESVHGDPVELVPMALSDFEAHALPGSAAGGNRPSFIRARVVLDRLDGGIAAIVARKSRLDAEEAAAIATDALDGYVNSLYRSLKNLRDGRPLAGHLDAADSIGPLLRFLFAIDGRVRPFSKYLEVDVRERPLAVADILARVESILATGDRTAQHDLFVTVEEVARARGFGAVIDSWQPDVPFLRGEPRVAPA